MMALVFARGVLSGKDLPKCYTDLETWMLTFMPKVVILKKHRKTVGIDTVVEL